LPNGGAILVIHDVTALKRLETVRRDFVANVSHELKTPLTSISGYAETLLTDDTDEATRKRFLEVIAANAHRMQRLVDDLLNLARLESGRWQATPELVDIAELAREVWSSFADRPAQRNVRLTVSTPRELRVWGDPEALRQILNNLFDNSLRHTPPGGEIAVAASATPGGVEIRVRD